MTEREYELLETRLEQRDGTTWVSGICPACWERHAFRAHPPGTISLVHCENGHLIRIADQTTAGQRARRLRGAPPAPQDAPP